MRWLKLLLTLGLAGALAASASAINLSRVGFRLATAQKATEIDMKKTAFFGRPTGDWVARVSGNQTTGDKTVCDVALFPGGSPFHASGAFQMASEKEPLVAAILSRDEVGRMLAVEIGRRFGGWKLISTAQASRVSLVVPSANGNGYHIYTTLPPLDVPGTIDRVTGILDDTDLNQIVIGSLAAEDNEVSAYVVREARRRGIRTYWIPTGSQLRSRRSAIEFLSLVDVVQMNRDELYSLARCEGIVPGINQLRSYGASGTIVCTDGPRGIVAFHDGDWYVQRAFDVDSDNGTERRLDVALGDTVAGTLAAWLADHQGRHFGDGLRMAAAAAAMRLANESGDGGWDGLSAWASKQAVLSPLEEKSQRIAAKRVILPVAVTLLASGALTIVLAALV